MNFVPCSGNFSIEQYPVALKVSRIESPAFHSVPNVICNYDQSNNGIFSNNQEGTTSQFHGQTQSGRHSIEQTYNNSLSNITSAQTHWNDISFSRQHLELIKAQLNTTSPTTSISNQNPQWFDKVVITRNASTMTDFVSWNHTENRDDSSKSSNEDFVPQARWDHCSKIQLKYQCTAMDKYLSRMQPSLPLSIQTFLNRHNITPAVRYSVSLFNKNCELQDGKLVDVKMSTALDGSTLFCCPDCQMAYSDRELLEQHMADHKTDRRFECNVCGAYLKRKEHLDQHKRGHSEERPFVCEVCCKGFKRNEHLRRHAVIHSGDKTHPCLECGKAFSRKDHLNKHMHTHVLKRIKSEVI